MEKVTLKRLRSDESENYFVHQRKVHVNDKIVSANDAAKMSQIHQKTLELLFNASAQLESNSDVIPLWEQVLLSGSGQIDFISDIRPVNLIKTPSTGNCCQREAFVQVACSSCNQSMCENCGYSCMDCLSFICGKCIAVFGCGTLDRPLCERCIIFN